MILAQLFGAFLRIGLFAIGGAYSFLPLIQKEVVERYQWLTQQEFLDVLGIVKIFPGAISIKFATYTGYKMAGIPGAIVANVANLLSPVILIVLATNFYTQFKGLKTTNHVFAGVQIAVFAMIVAVAFQTIPLDKITGLKNMLLIVAAFILFLYTKIHPAFIIIGAGIIGALAKL